MINEYLKKIYLFLYTSTMFLFNFASNFLLNYIESITLEVNKPTTDFFEKFYYNFVIYIYWTFIRIKFLIFKLFKKFMCGTD